MPLLKKKQPVLFAGENHMITLYRPGGDAIASASCWRCTYSEHGEGFVLLLWHDPAASGLTTLAPNRIYSDNAAMARMVTVRFNQYFEGFRGRGFADLTPQPARFVQQADGHRLHRIACINADASVELIWRNVFGAALEIFDNRSGPEPYDVSAVICHCTEAGISVDGQSIQGEVRRPDGASASSAFLAFSETWVGR